MKLKELESHLSSVAVFDVPKAHLEQYPTSAHLAARMLYTAATSYGDIEDAAVADLGTGGGILAIAAAMLGASHVVGYDIDPDALRIARANVAEMEVVETVDLVLCDIGRGVPLPPDRVRDQYLFDVVVSNPPFGTKNSGIDVVFLQQAIQLAPVVYSLHKSSTRDHLAKKARDWGFKFEVVAEMKFDIPQMYKFHKKKSVDVMVDMIRLSKE
ncbi:methyltransferase-like protein 5 [Blastocladiella britannica]|nr:methyltransferase-like protein 5 [Blastocladiella britannica]